MCLTMVKHNSKDDERQITNSVLFKIFFNLFYELRIPVELKELYGRTLSSKLHVLSVNGVVLHYRHCPVSLLLPEPLLVRNLLHWYARLLHNHLLLDRHAKLWS